MWMPAISAWLQPVADAARASVRLPRLPPKVAPGDPTIAELLSVDREFRRMASAGAKVVSTHNRMTTVASHQPVLETVRAGRKYTARFSDTPRALSLGKTRDWVVLSSEGPEGRRHHTVVTMWTGWLKGRRIVRSRELECANYHIARMHRARSGRN